MRTSGPNPGSGRLASPFRLLRACVLATLALLSLAATAESIPVAVDVTTTYPARYRMRVWPDGADEATARTFDTMPIAEGDEVSFGHGMCSGIFDPPSGTRVHFRLSLVGPEGREVPMPGSPLTAVFP